VKTGIAMARFAAGLRCLVAITVSLGTPAAATSQDVHDTADGSVRRVAYGPSPEQFGELRIPAGAGPFPVAILIHGGCFVRRFGATENIAEFADSLRHAGIATWNIGYRRVDSPGGGWPETFRDAGRAADHVRELARQFPLDTARVIAAGHSAGGYLALWLGARSVLSNEAELYTPDPLHLTAAVALGADGDLPPIAPMLATFCDVPVGERLLGADSRTVRSRRLQANPADMPRSHVRQVLIAGDADRFETPALRDGYVARARAKQEEIEVISIPGAGHFDVVNPKSAAWPTVKRALLAMLRVSG
jgi:acetyl esterase/lipase